MHTYHLPFPGTAVPLSTCEDEDENRMINEKEKRGLNYWQASRYMQGRPSTSLSGGDALHFCSSCVGVDVVLSVVGWHGGAART